jgi:hypothetical protein
VIRWNRNFLLTNFVLFFFDSCDCLKIEPGCLGEMTWQTSGGDHMIVHHAAMATLEQGGTTKTKENGDRLVGGVVRVS